MDKAELMAAIDRVPDPKLREALKVVAAAVQNPRYDRNETEWVIWEDPEGADSSEGLYIGIYQF